MIKHLSKEYDFFFLGNSRFGGLFHREQAFAVELANRGYKVTFIEEMPSIAACIRLFIFHLLYPMSMQEKKSTENVFSNLSIYRPPLVPTFFRSSYTRWYDQIVFKRWFHKKFKNKKWQKTIAIISIPYWWYGFVNRKLIPASIIIYDHYDALEMPSRNKSVLKIMKESEILLLKEVEMILYSAKSMENYLLSEENNINKIFLPNAVSSNMIKESKKYKKLSNQVIGYVGGMDERWFDRKLLLRIINEFPEIEIIIRGSADKGFIDKIKSYKNTHIIEFVDQSKIPSIISKFSVGIIPFIKNKISDVINPQKLYEYCAFGIPIVATMTNEMKYYRDLVFLANNHEEFILQIRKAMESNQEYLNKRRIEFAENNTWGKRIDTLLENIENILANKK